MFYVLIFSEGRSPNLIYIVFSNIFKHAWGLKKKKKALLDLNINNGFHWIPVTFTGFSS